MPNTHGHGSMIQFSYVFPTAGTYNIGVIYSQLVEERLRRENNQPKNEIRIE